MEMGSIVHLKCKKDDHLAPITCGLGNFTMTSTYLQFIHIVQNQYIKDVLFDLKKNVQNHMEITPALSLAFEYQTLDNKCGELVFTHMQLSLVG